MRLAQRNDSRGSKGQQVARFLGGIKPQFRDKKFFKDNNNAVEKGKAIQEVQP